MTCEGQGADLPSFPDLEGVHLATAHLNDPKAERPNLLVARFDPGTQVAGVLTRSSCAAAPVRWSRACLQEGQDAVGLVVNSGNANCYTGPQGFEVVERVAALAAGTWECDPKQVLICSTGRIGEQLDPRNFETVLTALMPQVGRGDWPSAAKAIMTTDRWPKAVVKQCQMGDETVTLIGITKGALMIAPNMATTLSFLFTDAAIPSPVLQAALSDAVEGSYNAISVDETTSTNDSILFFATGKRAVAPAVESLSDETMAAFRQALDAMLGELSQMIVKDGQGDGRLFHIRVVNAASQQSARRIARSVARSILVRRILRRGSMFDNGVFGAGQLIAAVGGSTERLNAERLALFLGGHCIVESGQVTTAQKAAVEEHLAGDRIVLTVDAAFGASEGEVWAVVDL